MFSEFLIDLQQSFLGERENPDAGQIVQGSKRIDFRTITIKGRTFLAPAKRFQRTIAFLHSRFNAYLFVFVQTTTYRKKIMPQFCFKIFRDTANFRQNIKILFSETIFDSTFSHYPSTPSSSRSTALDGAVLK